MEPWPFDQPKNCGSIVSRAVIEGRSHIAFVSHDEDDHGWQFLDARSTGLDEATVVSLLSVVKVDPSVLQVADLEPGWTATRTNRDSPWVRAPNQARA